MTTYTHEVARIEAQVYAEGYSQVVAGVWISTLEDLADTYRSRGEGHKARGLDARYYLYTDDGYIQGSDFLDDLIQEALEDFEEE